MISTYIFTGFLESGKTKCINNLINQIYDNNRIRLNRILIIQIEEGFTEVENFNNENIISVSLNEFNLHSDEVSSKITKKLKSKKYNEVWIENNGMIETNALYSYLQQTLEYLDIKKVIYTVDTKKFDYYYGNVGNSYVEQLTQADIVVMGKDDNYRQISKQIKTLNKNMQIIDSSQIEILSKAMYRNTINKNTLILAGTILFILFYYFFMYGLRQVDTSVNTLVSIYIGMVFQAIPFLALGVIISSLMLVFVPTDWFLRHFPKSGFFAYIYAIMFGFLLPVCDCASIPIFNSLIKKNAPVGPAITFLCATPVINPLVMISTYFAFSNNYTVVLSRVGLGIVVAIVVGLMFSKHKKEKIIENYNSSTIICNCGVLEDVMSDSNQYTFWSKIRLAVANSQNEFFNIIKYLLVGIFFSSIIQLYFPSEILEGLPFKDTLGVLILMVFSFVISLCSSSDAIVARGLTSKFSMSAAMSFMVFGPMMDIKNVVLLSGIFKKKFIYKLTVYAFITTFIVVTLVYGIGVIR